MRLRTLGGLALEPASFTRPKPLLLLAYLAIEGRRGRRFLAELFWPGAPDPRNNLTTALTQLRRGAPGAVEADRERAWTTIPCDARELIEAVEAGAFERALELYRGAFLEGAPAPHTGIELEEWIYGTREYLAALARRVRLQLARAAASRSAFDVAARHAERAWRLPGAPPPDARQIEAVHALLLSGDHPRAAELRAEARDYGLELALTPDRARAELRAAPAAGAPVRHNLPPPSTSFVGRRRELDELARHLARGECRLLSLVGTAGVGKTRLALQLGRALVQKARYPDGVYFVPLDALRDPRQVPGAVAAALGFVASDGSDPFAQLVRALGGARALLLLDNFEQLIGGAGVLSELLRACPRLALLVTSRERLRLAEERVYPLTGLSGPDAIAETGHGDAVRLFVQRAESADLRFALTPEALLGVERICRAVEGLPLGLELAAAWTRSLPVAEIADEIESNLELLTARTDDVPERHRSLHAAFEHSWRLLTPEEQRALRQLSVFRGGFTRDAAAEVAGASIPVLASLVSKSLLRVGPEGRFDRHPLLYQFTHTRLAEAPTERRAVEREHARFFLALMEAAQPKFTGPDAAAWLARIAAEHENLRAALDWAEANREVESGLRLATAALRFWIVRGHLHEGRARFETLLEFPANEVPQRVRAAALDGLATLSLQLGRVPQARELLRESLALWREVGDARRLATSLNHLGWTLFDLAEYDEARRRSEEARALHREHGDRRGEAVSLNNLGYVAFDRGDLREAEALLRASLDLRRELANPRGVSYGCANLGWVLLHRGREAEARSLIERADALNRRLEDDQMLGFTRCLKATLAWRRERVGEAIGLFEDGITRLRETGSAMGLSRFLCDLAEAMRVRGDSDRARELFDEHRTVCRRSEARRHLVRSQRLRSRLELAAGDRERAAALLTEGLALAWKIGARLEVAKAMQAIAELRAREGEAASAVRLHAAAAALRARLGAPPPDARRRELDADATRLRRELGDEAFGAAWRAGEGWRIEEAVAFELGDGEAVSDSGSG